MRKLLASLALMLVLASPARAVSYAAGSFEIYDGADFTKRFGFVASSVGTGTKRLLTVPNASGTLALLSDIPSLSDYARLSVANLFTGAQTIDNTTASDVLLKLVPHATQTAAVAQVRNAADTGDYFTIEGTGGIAGIGSCIFGDGLTNNFPFIARTIGTPAWQWGGIWDATAAASLVFSLDGAPAGGSLVFPAAGGTVVTTTAAQTLSAKTLAGTGIFFSVPTFAGNQFRGAADATKQIKVSPNNQSTGTTLTLQSSITANRTATFPDYAMIVAGAAAALTSGRVPFASTAGILTDDADMTFATDRLTVTKLTTTLETLTASAAPGSLVDGDLWNDSTQKAVQVYENTLKQTVSTAFYSQSALQTISNTVTESSLPFLGTGTLTLPASFFLFGKTIRLTATGDYGVTGTPTLRVRFKKGTTVIWDTGVVTPPSASSFWRICAILVGQSATVVVGNAWFEVITTTAGGGNPVAMSMGTGNSTVTIASASEALDLTVEWGTANPANTISINSMLLEVLN